MISSTACGSTSNTGGKVIPDLASIELVTDVYYDSEHGKEPLGLSITIMYYNSEKQVIAFNRIPVKIAVEIYGYKSEADLLTHQNPSTIYHKDTSIDHSAGVIELTQNKYIRIPFSDLPGAVAKYIQWGTVEAIVSTAQGIFEASKDMVPLYPE